MAMAVDHWLAFVAASAVLLVISYALGQGQPVGDCQTPNG
jgi:hypothetical protein